jgi:hypothetical protein
MKNIVCNFDNKRQHKNCQNINTCELNPTPSRYKKGLESDRLEAIEKEGLIVMKREGQEVLCTKKNCSQFGMNDLCQHGIKHEWTESCQMICERYQDSYCDGG